MIDRKTKIAAGAFVFALMFGAALQLGDIHSMPLALAAAACAIISLAYIIWHGTNLLRVHYGKASLKLEPMHLIVVGLLIAVAGVVWQFATSNPIPASPNVQSQNFEGRPIGWQWYGWNSNQGGGGKPPLFGGLRFLGKNITDEAVQLNKLTVISSITGNTISARIAVGQRMLEQTNPVPPQAEFIIIAQFPNDEMLAEKDYLAEWGAMKLVTWAGEARYTISFDEKTVAKPFEATHPKPEPYVPHVTERRQ
jgi:hypothetical protein